MKTSIKAKVLTLVLIAICFATFGIISLNTQTTANAYTGHNAINTPAGTINYDDGWDLSSISAAKAGKSSNPTGNYLSAAYPAGSLWAISTPITEKKDLVLELDWETSANVNNFIQFSPWSVGTAHEFPNPIYFNYHDATNGDVMNNATPASYTMVVQDLTNPESQPQVAIQYGYVLLQGYRYRFTFTVNGDMLLAKRVVGSKEEFVDELKVIGFQTVPEEITEANPRFFRIHMYQSVVLGDLLLRYADGTVIQQCMFDRAHVLAWGNKHHEPGYFTSDHTNGAIYETKPNLKNLTLSEKIISDVIVADSNTIPQNTRILTLEGVYDMYSFEAGKVLNFLFGLPEDLEEAKKATHTTAGVSCISLSFDGTNYWAHGYTDCGNKVWGPGGGIAVGNEFSFRGYKNADGTTQLDLYSNSDGGGRIGITVPSLSGRVAIQVGGVSTNEATEIRFSKLNISAYTVMEGKDKGVNFNSFDNTAINAKIDADEWTMNATPASQFADSTQAKGLNVTSDGTLFFEGTSDNTYFAPKGKYGNFVLEFDYYDFANKPAQVETWPAGYSPLGIGLGRSTETLGWSGINKLIAISSNVSLQVFDEGAFSAVNSADINFKDVWTRIKIVVINDKISVYTAPLAGKTYTELTAADYTLAAEAQYNSVNGYVTICGTEGAYFKLDNIRITNIDGKEDSFVDNVAIPDSYNEVTVTANANNDELGTVTGGGVVVEGTSVTLTATPAENYTFAGWYVLGAKVADTTEYTFTATSDVTVVAMFEKVKYTVTATAENGTVEGAGEYEVGATATLTATANQYYEFVKWTVNGEDAGTTATVTFTVEGNVEYVAVFAKVKYTVTATAENGTVEGAGEYEVGLAATLTATANENYEFVKWTVNGEDAGTTATVTFTVEGNVNYVAVFAKVKYTVTATAENGTVEGAGEYEVGATATLTATANENYEFVKWTVNGEDAGTTATVTFTVEGNVNYVAVFAKVKYTVTATAENGTVEGAGEYEVGLAATLTATANEGYVFDGWYVGEEKVSTEATYTFTVEANATVVAKFVEENNDSTSDTTSESTSEPETSENTNNGGGCVAGIGSFGFVFMAAFVAFAKVLKKKQD